MANADAAFGLRPVGGLDGSPYNGAVIRCVIPSGDATATYVGDPVKLSGTGVTAGDGSGTYPTVVQAAATDEFFGVVIGFEAAGGGNAPSLEDQYRKASTERFCHVVPALDNLFVVQSDGSNTIADIGQTTDLVIAAGSTVTGLSGVEMDANGTANANVQILGFYNVPDNDITAANARWIVRINESSLRGDGTAV